MPSVAETPAAAPAPAPARKKPKAAPVPEVVDQTSEPEPAETFVRDREIEGDYTLPSLELLTKATRPRRGRPRTTR